VVDGYCNAVSENRKRVGYGNAADGKSPKACQILQNRRWQIAEGASDTAKSQT
jgi:hypothetical protein